VENRFLLVGPVENPAGIEPDATVLEAMQRIHERRARFASRGDESGTHVRERELWRMIGLEPETNPGYVSLGQGMSALLRSADELRAYVLTDEATFRSLEASLGLRPIAVRGDGLRNVYVVTLLRGRDGRVNRSAEVFFEWLFSGEGRAAIDDFARRSPGFRAVNP
jgi:tungstate transport system substrate-binding protein